MQMQYRLTIFYGLACDVAPPTLPLVADAKRVELSGAGQGNRVSLP